MKYTNDDPRVARLTRRMIDAAAEERRRRFEDDTAPCDDSTLSEDARGILAAYSAQEIADMKLLVATYEAKRLVEMREDDARAAEYLREVEFDRYADYETDPVTSLRIQNTTPAAIAIGALCVIAWLMHHWFVGGQ